MVKNCCSFETERLYNVFRSMDDPYCSLCMMFNRHQKVIENTFLKFINCPYKNVNLALIMIKNNFSYTNIHFKIINCFE